MKSRYINRTFIQPDQSLREAGVMLKLNALPRSIRGKRLICVDDSIVRGTTSRRIIERLRRPERRRSTCGSPARRCAIPASWAWTSARPRS